MMTGIITRKFEQEIIKHLLEKAVIALLKQLFFFMGADQESVDKQTGGYITGFPR